MRVESVKIVLMSFLGFMGLGVVGVNFSRKGRDNCMQALVMHMVAVVVLVDM